MCDACLAKGVNWSLANGPKKSRLETVRFYKSFDDGEVKAKLCYLCSTKLFRDGERSFLVKNKTFCASKGLSPNEL